MKKWAFVSDFDGTISKKDFYHLVIEEFFPEGEALFKQWKRGEMLDIDFLSRVFSSIHLEEEELIKTILTLPLDDYIGPFIERVQQNGGDFYILSAGTDYYIKHIFDALGAENVEIISNKGHFKSKNIHLEIDKNDWSYSERYGIDKSKVIQKLKETYDTVYFYGDSEPDSHPAAFADVTFAKDALCGLLDKKGVAYIEADTFLDVETYLRGRGVLVI